MRHRSLAGIAGIVFALSACSQNSATPPSATDAAASETGASDAGNVAAPAHCCAALAADAGCPVSNPVVEPCWSTNPAGGFGRWTCSTGSCSDNGRSCAVGDTCSLPDIGCPGIVQQCSYPWGH